MTDFGLRDYQLDALNKMKNGCILCGGVGSGKSRTSLAYYYRENGGWCTGDKWRRKMINPKDLYIISTARKRDTLEWEDEMSVFGLSSNPELSSYKNKVVVDSWNNITKYKDIVGGFFIFDEQRVVGSGAWAKTFIKIAKANSWILLSATPGDTWSDYIPVFVANGFYRNRTEFNREHVVYSPYCKNFPKIDRYVGTKRLLKLRDSILVDMDFKRETVANHQDVYVAYDINEYKTVMKMRWNPFTNEPIADASGLCYVLRRIVNANQDRLQMVQYIYEHTVTKRVIIFYNFDYELELLRGLYYGEDVIIAEWNGHKHERIPNTKHWVYLVQYTAGAEGWNCTVTDTIIFYSQNYSYKIMIQAAGRTDRLNTPYKELYYWHLKTHAPIDLAISKALSEKKQFNERKFANF